MRQFSRVFIAVVAGLAALAQAAFADGPPRWKMADQDTKITIIGTFHVLPSDLEWMQPDIRQAIEESDKLYLELNPDQTSPAIMQPLVGQMAFWGSPDERLSNHLSEKSISTLESHLGGLGLNRSIMEAMEPWFVGVSLATVQMMQLGWQPDLGAERTLQAIAEKNGVPIEGLETAQLQLGVFDSLPVEAQVDFVETMLASFDTLEKDSTELLRAWSTGDVPAINASMNKGLKGNALLQEKLLAERNENWARTLDTLMKYPGTIVVAVGAGHLAGDQSMIKMLENWGYALERIDP